MYCRVTDYLSADWIYFKSPAGNEWARETWCFFVNPSLMLSGQIFGSFDKDTVGHRAVSQHLFDDFVYLSVVNEIVFKAVRFK